MSEFRFFFPLYIFRHYDGVCSGNRVKSSSMSFFQVEAKWRLGFRAADEATRSNPAGPHIAYGSSLQWGRSPSISPGTSSTRMTPEKGREWFKGSTAAHSFGYTHSQIFLYCSVLLTSVLRKLLGPDLPTICVITKTSFGFKKLLSCFY